jgi:hypothetical protein
LQENKTLLIYKNVSLPSSLLTYEIKLYKASRQGGQKGGYSHSGFHKTSPY